MGSTIFKTVIYDNGQKILSDQMEQEFQLLGILAYKINYVKNMILLSERGRARRLKQVREIIMSQGQTPLYID